MDKLLKPGRIIFAAGMIGLAVLCFVYKDFIVGRPPAWPANMDCLPSLAYVSATVLLLACAGILFNFRGMLCACIIAVLIFLLSLLRELPDFMGHWLATYKTLAFFGGALIIAASFSAKEKMRSNLALAGCICNAVFFISAGYAHFKFAGFVNGFIPDYIPFHPFWTYFCGVCLIAGGIGLLIPQTQKWAAFLSGIMVAGWFLLLHIPRFIANMNDTSDRLGLCESFAFAGMFFVLTALLAKPLAKS